MQQARKCKLHACCFTAESMRGLLLLLHMRMHRQARHSVERPIC